MCLALLTGCFVVSCATDKAPRPKASKSASAKSAFEDAQDAFEAGNYLESVRSFQQVKSRYPYSVYAPLAELGVADSHFALSKYAEAAEGYRVFVRFHPHHEKVVYARFRIGESYMEQMPSNWFFMPPAYERDLESVKDALRELQAFLAAYGESPYAARARKMVGVCRKRLGDHELYVARFYVERKRPSSAISRLERVIRDYEDVGLAGEALFLLGTVYRDALGAPDKARGAFQRILDQYPADLRAEDAKLALEALGS